MNVIGNLSASQHGNDAMKKIIWKARDVDRKRKHAEIGGAVPNEKFVARLSSRRAPKGRER